VYIPAQNAVRIPTIRGLERDHDASRFQLMTTHRRDVSVRFGVPSSSADDKPGRKRGSTFGRVAADQPGVAAKPSPYVDYDAIDTLFRFGRRPTEVRA
jgi:hypothetical protein